MGFFSMLRYVLAGLAKTAGAIVDFPLSFLSGLFSSGKPPIPTYEPRSSKSDILDDYQVTRAAAIHTLGRDSVGVVRKFCAAPKSVRDTMDLGQFDAKAQALLLTMGDDELGALSQASDAKVRKFCLGQQHDIYGVPVAGIHEPHPADASATPREVKMSAEDRVKWAIKARADRNVDYEPMAIAKF